MNVELIVTSTKPRDCHATTRNEQVNPKQKANLNFKLVSSLREDGRWEKSKFTKYGTYQ